MARFLDSSSSIPSTPTERGGRSLNRTNRHHQPSNVIVLDDDDDNSNMLVDSTHYFSMDDLVATAATEPNQLERPNNMTVSSSMDDLLLPHNNDLSSLSSSSSNSSGVSATILHNLESKETWIPLPPEPWETPLVTTNDIQKAIYHRAAINKLGMTTIASAVHHNHALACYIFQSLSFEHPHSWWHHPTQLEHKYLYPRRKREGLTKYLDKKHKSPTYITDMMTPFCQLVDDTLKTTLKTYSVNTTVLFYSTSLNAQAWLDALMYSTVATVASADSTMMSPAASSSSPFRMPMSSPPSLASTTTHYKTSRFAQMAQLWQADQLQKFGRYTQYSIIKRPYFGLLLFIIVLWLHYRPTFFAKHEVSRQALITLFRNLCVNVADSFSFVKSGLSDNDFSSTRQLLQTDANIIMLLIHAWRASCFTWRCYFPTLSVAASEDLNMITHRRNAETLSNTAQKCFTDNGLNVEEKVFEWLNVMIVWILNDMSMAVDNTLLDAKTLPVLNSLQANLGTLNYLEIAEKTFTVMKTIFL